MKKIFFLLLFTIASYGQAVFDEGIQLTNTESTTATKVNVQEANGKVNTKTINTAFNKNFGLNSGDVVGATTLLNQYSTTPVDWTATAFNSGQVVFYGGKQWIAKMATVAGDVPSVSSKWEEITFEALSNKTVIVDAIPTDGSNNAVSSNGVFDALATKAPISSVHNPVTLGTANGLSLSNQQLSLGLASSGVTGALSGTDWNTFNGKFNTPTGLTTNYLPKWNGSEFGNSQFFDNGDNVGIGTTNPISNLHIQNGIAANTIFTIQSFGTEAAGEYAGIRFKSATNSINQYAKGFIGFRNNGTGYGRGDIYFSTNNGETTDNASLSDAKMVVTANGNVGIGNSAPSVKLEVTGTIKATSYTGSATLTGTPTAPTAPAGTNTTQVATTAFVQQNARPYKVYTAFYTQQGTANPSFTVLENTIGSVSWSRTGTGTFVAASPNLFTLNKTFITTLSGTTAFIINATTFSSSDVGLNFLSLTTGSLIDGVNTNKNFIEIRVYN